MQKLAVIAIAGLTISAVCFGGVAAVGAGQGLRGTGWDGFDFSLFGDRPRCEAGSATATSRDIPWDGSDQVGLALGGQAFYTPGAGDRVHVTGDPALVAHVRVKNGTIKLDCRGWGDESRDLRITLPGREFRKFGIAGSGKLTLQKLNQDRLKLSIAGSGSILADGAVDNVEVHIAGSGDADLGRVSGRRAEVHIAGSGNTDIAPRDEADIHIAGSGDVNLHSNPRNLNTKIAGSGRIHNISPGGI